MIILSYVLAGVLSALFFVDTFLTLDGVNHSNGLIEEKTKYMRWFVQSPWRAYPLTILECCVVVAIIYWANHFGGGIVSCLFCVALILHRVIVTRKNYKLNLLFVVKK